MSEVLQWHNNLVLQTFDDFELDDKHRCKRVMQCLIWALFSLVDSSGMFLQNALHCWGYLSCNHS